MRRKKKTVEKSAEEKSNGQRKTDREPKSGERRRTITAYNYCNNKLFTLCDQFLLVDVTRGKNGNCCLKNNADYKIDDPFIIDDCKLCLCVRQGLCMLCQQKGQCVHNKVYKCKKS